MKKLTVEKCQYRIEQLKTWGSINNRGITAREEDYIQALEIALPILEQQERGEGEWIEWSGGKQPIAIGKKVDVRYRDGVELYGMQMGALFQPNGSHMDIIAYRIIPERATNQNGEQ